jgi:hypothetical protein
MNRIVGSIMVGALCLWCATASAQIPPAQPKRTADMETHPAEIKTSMLGEWTSIAPEVRPSATKNADGTLKPFYLKRAFKALPGDRFELEIINSADPYGAVPLVRISLKGHMLWRTAPDRRRRA